MACLLVPLFVWLGMAIVSVLLRDAGVAKGVRLSGELPACAACRYSLVGLAEAAPCPECGCGERLTSTARSARSLRTGFWVLPWAVVAAMLGAAPGIVLWYMHDVQKRGEAIIVLAIAVVHAVLVVFAGVIVAQRAERPRPWALSVPEGVGGPRGERWLAFAALALLAGGQMALGIYSIVDDLTRVPSPGTYAYERQLGVLLSPLATAMMSGAAYIAVALVVVAVWNTAARRRRRET